MKNHKLTAEPYFGGGEEKHLLSNIIICFSTCLIAFLFFENFRLFKFKNLVLDSHLKVDHNTPPKYTCTIFETSCKIFFFIAKIKMYFSVATKGLFHPRYSIRSVGVYYISDVLRGIEPSPCN